MEGAPVTRLQTAGALLALAYFLKRKQGDAPLAYRNGVPVSVELVAIDDQGHLLHAPAAAAFTAMRAAAAKVGVPMVVESAFRTMEQQTALWVDYMNGKRKDPVGAPGYSNHQNGVAVDVKTDRGRNATYAWLRANADAFGFVENVTGEPWHWEFRHG
jgi:LAS superfamily LD-carboxypeptidase LdcB